MADMNFFKFEDKDRDFPFYADNPKLERDDWIALFLIIIIPIFYLYDTLLDILYLPGMDIICMFVIPFCLVLYICRGKAKYFLYPIRKKDILLMIVIIILSILLSLGLCYIVFQEYIPFLTILCVDSYFKISSVLFELFGEELFKFAIFIIVLTFSFRKTKNRRLSIVLAWIMTMILFGAMHWGTYGRLIQVIIIQGFGSVFDIFGYIKTKNVLVSYITHVAFDVICNISIFL